MRIIMYTGKGGVGKTSVAAATALRCAELGYRTIIMSTDPAHSLGDSFDMELGPQPVEVVQLLQAQEVDVLYQMEKHWGELQGYLSALMAWRGVDEIIAEETAVLPGMEEMASLLQIVGYYDDGNHDVIIIDAAPTGETLRLLSLPESAKWYLEKVFPLERKAVQLIGPMVKPFTDIPLPDDATFEAIKELITYLTRMQELLADPEKSTIRLVLNPEKMVIREAQRTFTYLNLYGFHTDLVVSNRIIPDEVQDAHFQAWKEQQERYGRLIGEAFSPLPILKAPLFDQELVGIPMLRKMAESLFGEKDPCQVYYRGKAQSFQKRNGAYQLSIRLPFVEKQDVQLTRVMDELVVHVGNYKRNIILPRALWGLDVEQAKLDEQSLVITFQPAA
jgi:arsenite-transporting ATPase